MGTLLRILGGVWVGIGLLDLYMISMETPITTITLNSHVITYVIPSLLVLGIGVVVGMRQDARSKAKDDPPLQ